MDAMFKYLDLAVSWVSDVERMEGEFTVNQKIAVAQVYATLGVASAIGEADQAVNLTDIKDQLRDIVNQLDKTRMGDIY